MKSPNVAIERVLAPVRRRITPSPTEEAALTEAVAALRKRAEDVAGEFQREGRPPFEPALVGSAAKDTWLHGRVDLDLFLMFPEALDRAALEEAGLEAGLRILPEHTLRYAEHPYVHGVWSGYPADVVPAHRVASASGIKSAVDRTPFHNEWVLERLQERPGLRGDIRLLKAFLQGIGTYGAETSLGAVSGYLAEVLAIDSDGFLATLERFRGLEEGSRIDPTGGSDARFPADVLVVIDPVDPGRNAASAVTREKLGRMRDAAAAFLEAPSERFFTPLPLVPLPPDDADRFLAGRGAVVVSFPTPEMREDARVPHLRRAAEALGARLGRTGFAVTKSDAGLSSDGSHAWLLVMTEDRVLPETRRHPGPPADAKERAERFRAKYRDHPLVVSGPDESEVDGEVRLVVTLREEVRELVSVTADLLGRGIHLGKHVDRSRAKGPVALRSLAEALADDGLAQGLSETIVPVPPWTRTGDVAQDYGLT
ncbi:MAG: CCA tRNA nucleotidyltransferase [Euryarchaeota archaeon]|nr:CCA tRNA nucleotidyltransferase [Euryarchaeota archaeon]